MEYAITMNNTTEHPTLTKSQQWLILHAIHETRQLPMFTIESAGTNRFGLFISHHLYRGNPESWATLETAETRALLEHLMMEAEQLADVYMAILGLSFPAFVEVEHQIPVVV
jgi:hypothetical protein